MRNCIKRFGFGTLLLVVMGGVLAWQGQNYLADRLLARYLPDLHYTQVSVDGIHGRLLLQGVKIELPGVVVDGGDVEVGIHPMTLLRGPIGLETVMLRGLKVMVDPEKLSSFSTPSSGAVMLPEHVFIQAAVVTVVQKKVPHLLPLHVDGEASHGRQGWSFQSKLKLARGVVRSHGTVADDRVQGDVQLDGVTIVALLQQLGVAYSDWDPQGSVDGSLAWELPLSSPDAVQLQGDVRLRGVTLMAQQQRQKVGDVTVKLAWQGESSLLQLQNIELQQPHLRWLYQRSKHRDKTSFLTMPSSFHWQLDHLQVVGGRVDIDAVTAAGEMHLLVGMDRLDVRDVTWKSWWPKRANMQATVAKGTVDWSLENHAIDLNVRGVSLVDLEPLLISFTGLRVPKGSLGLRLQGSVAAKLKLFGELTIHQLVLAPRIPVAGVDLSIPYALGLRALTDDDGVTHIPLAIRGTVGSPDVDVIQIIAEVKKHLFNRVLDGGFKHLSIDFLANQQSLTPTGETQLEQLVHLLRENTKLKVTMRGCVSDRLALPALHAQKLAAARVQVVRDILKRRLQRAIVVDVIYQTLTKPSPDIDGKEDRVEVSLYPNK